MKEKVVLLAGFKEDINDNFEILLMKEFSKLHVIGSLSLQQLDVSTALEGCSDNNLECIAIICPLDTRSRLKRFGIDIIEAKGGADGAVVVSRLESILTFPGTSPHGRGCFNI